METAAPNINWLIGRRVAALRQIMDWSQSELGAQIGMNQEAISRAERGKRPFTFEELLAIAAATGYNVVAIADATWPYADGTVTIQGTKHAAANVRRLVAGDLVNSWGGESK